MELSLTLLKQCFTKFQETNQLPEGDFNILWVPQGESPRDEATTKYLNVLSEKIAGETEEKQRIEATGAMEAAKTEIKPLVQGETKTQ